MNCAFGCSNFAEHVAHHTGEGRVQLLEDYRRNVQLEADIYEKYGRSEAFRRMRENVAKENGGGYHYLIVAPNYFAPDRFTYYTGYFGDQRHLWESRKRDGELWSAFLARNIAREF